MAADPGVVPGQLRIGGRPRSFAMRLPPAADGPIPLVIVLHGNTPGGGGWLMRQWTTFAEWTVHGGGHSADSRRL
jgi:poly(3-hydroxybutyrate) depolymerase